MNFCMGFRALAEIQRWGNFFSFKQKFEFLMLYSKPLCSESEPGFISAGEGAVTHQFSRAMTVGWPWEQASWCPQ